MSLIRKPAVAGLFYPGDAPALLGELSHLLAKQTAQSKARPRFLIVPHAGYSYSGAVAAAAFAEIQPYSYPQVYLLGPSHHFYFPGAASSSAAAWATPLGELPLTPPVAAFAAQESYHKPEHSLEVQLPFIQRLLPQARITPILVSGGLDQAKALAKELQQEDPSALWVISSDLHHAGPRFGYLPKDHGFGGAAEMDASVLEKIVQGDLTAFRAFVTQHQSTVCGALPILIALHLCKIWGGGNFTLKTYDNSQRQTGGSDHVGYAALYC